MTRVLNVLPVFYSNSVNQSTERQLELQFYLLEQYDRAIEDFKACLEHYTKTLEDKLDRRIAEIHYNIGLAFSFDKKFEESVTSFKEAKSLLESRLDMLKGKIEKHEKESGKGKAPTELLDWNKEMKELEDLVLLDMNAKVISSFMLAFVKLVFFVWPIQICENESLQYIKFYYIHAKAQNEISL